MNKKKFVLMVSVLVAGLIVVGTLLLSGPHMIDQPSLRAFETPMNLPPENSVQYKHEDFKPEEIVMPEVDEVSLEKGKVYYGYFCIFCHGEDGKGNGPVGQSYVPKPADLNSDTIRSYTTPDLYRHSFTGTGHEPVLERVVPEDFRRYILLYIREEFNK